MWLHVVNEFAGKPRPVWGTLMRSLGRLTGAPDYLFLWQGGCGGIEMKTRTGRLTGNQQIVKDWFEKNNVPYVVCRSSDEALQVLREWGVYKS